RRPSWPCVGPSTGRIATSILRSFACEIVPASRPTRGHTGWGRSTWYRCSRPPMPIIAWVSLRGPWTSPLMWQQTCRAVPADRENTRMQFRDKVVLVTGASRGIGAAIARAFGREGALVIVNYLQNASAAAEVAEQCTAAGGDGWAMQADVRDPVAVAAMVNDVLAETGRIDAVVNNAFRGYRFNPDTRERFQDLNWQAYREQFEGAVQGTMNVCRAVIPGMRERASG